MIELLKEIQSAAAIYRDFTEKASGLDGPLDRVGLFAYRVTTMESEVIKPVLLAILDHKAGPLPPEDIANTLDVLESWLIRRMLVRATGKSYNKVLAEVVSIVRNASPGHIGQTIREHFASQRSETSYWPDDDELRKELEVMPIYRKLSRARLRMTLESIEDHWRGWIAGQESAAGMRIRRGSYSIEHLMPQSWIKHWPLPAGVSESERDVRIHRLGNLTLLTRRLNSTVSNGPWLGEGGKAAHLQEKDVVLLNSRLLKDFAAKTWDETGIDNRTKHAIDTVLNIWPAPPGHKVSIEHERTDSSISVEVSDLIGAGFLSPGQSIYSRPGKYGGHTGRILSDGRIEVAGQVFESPSRAGIFVRKKNTNGWNFWRLEPNGRRQLKEVRAEYLRVVAPDESDDENDDA